MDPIGNPQKLLLGATTEAFELFKAEVKKALIMKYSS